MQSLIPFVEQYFGHWAMRPEQFLALHRHVMALDISVHLAGPQAQMVRDGSGMSSYDLVDGIATFDVAGTLMKQESSLGGTSTVAMRRAVRAAQSDSMVKAGMFKFDSPGGTVSGTCELGDDIAAFAAAKPCASFVDDMGCSAAYWLASQCPVISVNRTGIVGSIGTYGIVLDTSGAAEKAGFVVHVVKAGEFKGSGQPGTEITPEQLGELQKIIDGMNSHFLDSVSAGRRMPMTRVKGLADGRCYIGADAVAAGLADYCETMDTAYDRLRSQITATQPLPPTAAASTSYSPALASRVQVRTPAPPDPIAEFDSMVRAAMRVKKCDRQAAIKFVSERAPELHSQYVAESDRRSTPKRQGRERVF